MRVVSWNCAGKFREKYRVISSLDADVYVVQECEDPSQQTGEYAAWAGRYLWVGDSKFKGLGVFAKNSLSIEPLKWDLSGVQFFLPFAVNSQLTIVGVWTKFTTEPRLDYVDQVWSLLSRHRQELERTPCLLTGDFNSNSCWDKKYGSKCHSKLVEELRKSGLISIYHALTGDSHGGESTPTLVRDHAGVRTYHIDYAFLSGALMPHVECFTIGNRQEWRIHSDHMPLVVDIDL
jgi:exonuclease III